MAIIVFSGCTKTVYTNHKPPKIKQLHVVKDINFSVKQHCICGKDVDNVVAGIKMLRASELYYFYSVGKYNEGFTDELK